MDLTSNAGVSCRVWLPDSVLAAGAKLKEALEGIRSANIEHLRRKHVGAKFSVKGQPSTEPAPWRRLHVVVTCPTTQMLAKAQADVVDLCETACDVAADILGLSDDQVQDAFERIRVERQESTRIEGPLQLPLPMPAPIRFVNAAAADTSSIWRDESPNPKQASPTSWPPSEADGAPVLAQQGLGTTPKSATPAVMPPRPKVRGIPAAFAVRLPRTMEPVSLPTPSAMMQGLQIAPPTPLPARPPEAMNAPLTPAVPLMPTPPALPASLTPPAELPGGPHTLDAHLEVARLAQAWLDRGSRKLDERPRKRARTRLESDPYLVRANTENPYLTMLKEAEAEDGMALPEDSPMPPPNSIVAHKRKAKLQAIPGPPKVGQDAQVVDEESKSNSSTSESDSDSEGEGEESEEPDDDEVEELDDAAVPSASSVAGIQVHLGSEPRLQLYKLGAKCCDVFAHFVGGNENSLPENHRLDIDQRVRLEHCRRHLQWADDLTTVWHFSLSEAREKDAWAALRNYFVSRKRVGLSELPRSVVYIVPPDKEFLSELGLPAAAESLAGSLVGLQVPLYQSEGNPPQDRDSELPELPVPMGPPSEQTEQATQPPTAEMHAVPAVPAEPEASVPQAQASEGLPAELSLQELQTEAAEQGNVEGLRMSAKAPSEPRAALDDSVERLEERSGHVVQDAQAGGIPETCDTTSQVQMGETQDVVIEAAGVSEGAGGETLAELAMKGRVVSRTTADTCSKAEPIRDSSDQNEDGEANGSQPPDDSSAGAVSLEEDLST